MKILIFKITGIIKQFFLIDLESNCAVVELLLLFWPRIFSVNRWVLYTGTELQYFVLVFLYHLVQSAVFQIRHRKLVRSLSLISLLKTLSWKFDLVEKPERDAAFLLHYLVYHLAIELNLDLPQCFFNQIKVVDFWLLVFSEGNGLVIMKTYFFVKLAESVSP